MPWQRRHRRLTESTGFFLALGSVVLIVVVVLTLLYLLPDTPSSSPTQ